MTKEIKPSIIWFNDDLRIADHEPLAAAAKQGPIIGIYLVGGQARAHGGASKWWLHHSLKTLAKNLANIGGQLVLKGCDGPTHAADIMTKLAIDYDAHGVYWHNRFNARDMAQDGQLAQNLGRHGIKAQRFDGNILVPPARLNEVSGKENGYLVYTPFQKAISAIIRGNEIRLSAQVSPNVETTDQSWLTDFAQSLDLLLPLPTAPNWANGFGGHHVPGEEGAWQRLGQFTNNGLKGYKVGRDFPALAHCSNLSAHLRFGEISPLRVWQVLEDQRLNGTPEADIDKAQAELIWREFAQHLFYNAPSLATENWRKQFDRFPWRDDPENLKRWKRGQTGIPIVDAGMRQLWTQGFMANRVRMIVASFLTKHLLIDWRVGEQYFYDCLVDADPASNPANWQWVAGSGADGAPYFRIFNPTLQSEKFDGAGDYIRQFVPELAGLSNGAIHAPWKAKPHELAAAQVRLGYNYPIPCVDLATGRQRALDAFSSLNEPAASDFQTHIQHELFG